MRRGQGQAVVASFSALRYIKAGGRNGVRRIKWCVRIWTRGWRSGALVPAHAGRKLAAGRKPPWPKAADVDGGGPRSGHPARYLWAQLLARIYGVFARKCSGCGGRVRLIGFITEPATVRQILAYVGEPTSAPAIAPTRSPPVDANAQQLIAAEAVEAIPELEFD